VFCVFGYADDLILLTPTVAALKKLSEICENNAKKYDVTFNGKKSQLIIFKCRKSRPPDPGITINNAPVSRVNEIIHLGHYLNEDIYRFDASKCIGDFYSMEESNS
jgi:hypothetical protein